MQQIEHLLRQWSSKSSKSGKSGKRRRMPRLKKRTSVVLGAMRRCDGMGIPSDATLLDGFAENRQTILQQHATAH
jgi:Mg-chelatase subunit ChlD